jgi:hypothetical protein
MGKLHNEELNCLYFFTKYYDDNQIKRTRWAWACSKHKEIRNVYKILDIKFHGKRPLTRPRHRWEDNIRME